MPRFPGCVGSWDFQHWEWKNCPEEWAGQLKGKEKKPTIVLEAVADGELWIWECHVGSPVSMNDFNILESSPIVSALLEGNQLPTYEYIVNGTKRSDTYFLVDGIYQLWEVFVNTISQPSNKKEVRFSEAQEGVWKDEERAFGVLISRWSLLAKPRKTWNRAFVSDVMKDTIILHSMVVEVRRDGYDSELWALAGKEAESGFDLDENGSEKVFMCDTPDSIRHRTGRIDDTQWAKHMSKNNARMKDEFLHHSLKMDLVEHIWNEHGLG